MNITKLGNGMTDNETVLEGSDKEACESFLKKIGAVEKDGQWTDEDGDVFIIEG